MSEMVNEAREAPSGSAIEELWSSLTPGARFEAFKTCHGRKGKISSGV